MRVAAYVYSGWHPIPERDASFAPGFTEWDLVRSCRPRFDGHHQPRVPLLGEYDDRDSIDVERRVRLARDHGVEPEPEAEEDGEGDECEERNLFHV